MQILPYPFEIFFLYDLLKPFVLHQQRHLQIFQLILLHHYPDSASVHSFGYYFFQLALSRCLSLAKSLLVKPVKVSKPIY